MLKVLLSFMVLSMATAVFVPAACKVYYAKKDKKIVEENVKTLNETKIEEELEKKEKDNDGFSSFNC